MSQQISHEKSDGVQGCYRLLEECRLSIERGRSIDVLPHFHRFFLAAFEGMLVPRLRDLEFQGIIPNDAEIEEDLPVLPLLAEGGALIASLFFREANDKVHLLPLLPPEFHCGRWIGRTTAAGDQIEMEWSKKTLKKVVIRPHSDREISLVLPKEITGYRIRSNMREKGKKGMVVKHQLTLSLQSGTTVILDRFQK
jgi:hypothetical protein